jgi:hypothetical protein
LLKKELLQKIEWLQFSHFDEDADLQEEVISHLTFGMLEEEFTDGTQIYTEGDMCEFTIFIIEGKVNIEMMDF